MSLLVLDPGPLTTVQDRGRPGWAHLGVPVAGVLDTVSAALALRLVGASPEEALLETTVGGVSARVDGARWMAVTGADGPLTIAGRPAPRHTAVWVPDGAVVEVGAATRGVRAYVAFAGGVAVEPVLGSRSTDTLAGVGPPVLRAGAVLPLGAPSGSPTGVEAPGPVARRRSLRVWPGPRRDWLVPGAWEQLLATSWSVGAASNRVGLRLQGAGVPRREGEIASEGMVAGAVQLPPDGQPVVFLADHPVTGGYPVVAVVDAGDLPVCAQLRPGERVTLRPARR